LAIKLVRGEHAVLANECIILQISIPPRHTTAVLRPF